MEKFLSKCPLRHPQERHMLQRTISCSSKEIGTSKVLEHDVSSTGFAYCSLQRPFDPVAGSSSLEVQLCLQEENIAKKEHQRGADRPFVHMSRGRFCSWRNHVVRQTKARGGLRRIKKLHHPSTPECGVHQLYIRHRAAHRMQYASPHAGHASCSRVTAESIMFH